MTHHLTALRRRARLALAAAALAAAAACADDDLPIEVEEEPEVARIIVTANGTTATIDHAQGTQSGRLTLRRLQPNVVTFRFVDADGDDEAVLVEEHDEFELRGGNVMPTSLIFVPGGGAGASWQATITPSTAGQVTIPFQLYNLHHGHAELTRAVVADVEN